MKKGAQKNFINTMGLQIDLHAKLKEYFGFDHFKGNQEAIIRNVLAGNNTFVLMPYNMELKRMEPVEVLLSPHQYCPYF